MRKNVIFIANFNHILKGTNAILSKTFNMQMCPPEPGMVERTLDVLDTDLVLWYISELQFRQLSSISDAISMGNVRYGVVVFGTPEECTDFQSHFCTRINVVKYLFRPVTAPEIVSAVGDAVSVPIVDESEKAPSGTPASAAPAMSLSDFAASLDEDKRRCILLVDDDGRILRAMKMILEKDYRVNVANSAKSAFDSIDRDRPDAILLDYEMPICDGRQTLEIIRKSDATKDLPVFFLTGVSDKERIKEVVSLRPQGYFLKNSEQGVILGALEKFFNENQNKKV